MEDVCAVLGRNLGIWRRERGLSQEKLQEATGVSQQYLSGLERGTRNPTVRTLAKIAAALDVQPADLLRIEPPDR